MFNNKYKLILFVLLMLFICKKDDSVFAATSTNYQASTDFSSIQGNKGWFYMEKSATGYTELKWNSANNQWKGSTGYLVVGSNNQHPDNNNYASVRKWVAPISGNITITSNGNIRKQDTSGGDGVIVKVYKNDFELWSNYIAGTDGKGISFPARSIEVKAGDAIYFEVSGNGDIYYDMTIWDPKIEYKSYTFLASKDFNAKQGQNGWYYMEKADNEYIEMKWDSANNRWQGNYEYLLVGNNNQHPNIYDSVRKWVAPISGNIIITSNGNVRKQDTSGGDGVIVKVFKNDIEIWSSYIDGTDGIGVSFPAKSLEVKEGDTIYFVVNKNGDIYCDMTIWDPKIEYKSYSYQASKDFNANQGLNGWYYMEKLADGYTELKWNTANNQWEGSKGYLIVGSNYQHPDNNNYTSVRKWVAPVSGNIIITSNGNIRKKDTSGGDGVIVKVYKNDIEIWSNNIAGTDGKGVSFPARSLEVKEGDAIYFEVNGNKDVYYDTTIWDPKIEYKSYSFQASKDFNAKQGLNGWYYMEKTDNRYAELKWNSSNNQWQGSKGYLIVGNNYQHPDNYNYISVRKWVAPVSGNIIITSNGNIRKQDTSGGDGVIVKVYKNDIEIWSNSIAGTDGKGVSFPARSLEVKEGDAIYFEVSGNGDIYYDMTIWDPRIDYMGRGMGEKYTYIYDASKQRLDYIAVDGKPLVVFIYDNNGNLLSKKYVSK